MSTNLNDTKKESGPPVKFPLSGNFAPYALVDQCDVERLSPWCWWAIRDGRSLYAIHYLKVEGQSRQIRMHRFLLNVSPGILVDHRDGNGLNNTRANLRIASIAENNRNRKAISARAGFKGVRAVGPKWRAEIRRGTDRLHLGMFSTPTEAAIAYDAAALDLFGEFACLNFPKEVHHV